MPTLTVSNFRILSFIPLYCSDNHSSNHLHTHIQTQHTCMCMHTHAHNLSIWKFSLGNYQPTYCLLSSFIFWQIVFCVLQNCLSVFLGYYTEVAYLMVWLSKAFFLFVGLSRKAHIWSQRGFPGSFSFRRLVFFFINPFSFLHLLHTTLFINTSGAIFVCLLLSLMSMKKQRADDLYTLFYPTTTSHKTNGEGCFSYIACLQASPQVSFFFKVCSALRKGGVLFMVCGNPGKAEWMDKGHRRCLILWRRIQDWAELLLSFVSVCPLFCPFF
jgi:hypothetical protein